MAAVGEAGRVLRLWCSRRHVCSKAESTDEGRSADDRASWPKPAGHRFDDQGRGSGTLVELGNRVNILLSGPPFPLHIRFDRLEPDVPAIEVEERPDGGKPQEGRRARQIQEVSEERLDPAVAMAVFVEHKHSAVDFAAQQVRQHASIVALIEAGVRPREFIQQNVDGALPDGDAKQNAPRRSPASCQRPGRRREPVARFVPGLPPPAGCVGGQPSSAVLPVRPSEFPRSSAEPGWSPAGCRPILIPGTGWLGGGFLKVASLRSCGRSGAAAGAVVTTMSVLPRESQVDTASQLSGPTSSPVGDQVRCPSSGHSCLSAPREPGRLPRSEPPEAEPESPIRSAQRNRPDGRRFHRRSRSRSAAFDT